jgi:hypothetical protein
MGRPPDPGAAQMRSLTPRLPARARAKPFVPPRILLTTNLRLLVICEVSRQLPFAAGHGWRHDEGVPEEALKSFLDDSKLKIVQGGNQ